MFPLRAFLFQPLHSCPKSLNAPPEGRFDAKRMVPTAGGGNAEGMSESCRRTHATYQPRALLHRPNLKHLSVYSIKVAKDIWELGVSVHGTLDSFLMCQGTRAGFDMECSWSAPHRLRPRDFSGPTKPPRAASPHRFHCSRDRDPFAFDQAGFGPQQAFW